MRLNSLLNQKMKRLFAGYYLVTILLIAGAISLCSSCKKDKKDSTDNSTPGANAVWMKNTAFTPQSITVPVNTTVTWTNKDGITHTVTSTTGLFDSGNIGNGGTFTYQFTTAGTYPYRCTIHSGMSGTVVVQ
jgi:plastocyanin